MNEANGGLSRTVTIVNALGLHARSAAAVARLAAEARAGVALCKGQRRADATSIMDLLTLECPEGTQVTVSVDDPADAPVLERIAALIENGFGE